LRTPHPLEKKGLLLAGKSQQQVEEESRGVFHALVMLWAWFDGRLTIVETFCAADVESSLPGTSVAQSPHRRRAAETLRR
jgi:hypothetical protein